MSRKPDPPPRFSGRRSFHEFCKQTDAGPRLLVTQAEFEVLRNWCREPVRRCGRAGVWVDLSTGEVERSKG